MSLSKSALLFVVVSAFCCEVSLAEQANEVSEKSTEKSKSTDKANTTKKLYRIVDKNGKVSYSDQPSKGAKEIELKEVTSIKMKKSKVSLGDLIEENEQERDPNAGYYDIIAFQTLKNDSIVRNNSSSVPLTAVLDPNLSKAHFIEFFMDGKSVGEKQKSLSIVVPSVEYGPHTTFFRVISRAGKTVQQSETITFNLLHIVRKRVSNVNSFAGDYFKSKLPQHPKLKKYEPTQTKEN